MSDTQSTDEGILEIERVCLHFGGVRAVDDCSFAVPPGSITGLIGPNGAGKTTLFNIISGFLRPNSGRIRLAGEDIIGLPAHRLFQQGLVRTFQIPRMFEQLSVLENLMLVPGAQIGERLLAAWFRAEKVRGQEREIRRRAQEVLAFLQLTQVAHEYAGNLSGGQKKLVELGRTMMTEAQVVLLDEPGAGVNPTLLKKLCDDIRRINREFGRTVCIIEHNMDVIAELCEPIVVMAEGKVLMQGTIQQVRADRTVQEAYLGVVVEPVA